MAEWTVEGIAERIVMETTDLQGDRIGPRKLAITMTYLEALVNPLKAERDHLSTELAETAKERDELREDIDTMHQVALDLMGERDRYRRALDSLADAVRQDIRATGPFKITPSENLQKVLMAGLSAPGE